jgi:hypothetical protein
MAVVSMTLSSQASEGGASKKDLAVNYRFASSLAICVDHCGLIAMPPKSSNVRWPESRSEANHAMRWQRGCSFHQTNSKRPSWIFPENIEWL